jgi:hypothetical protein
VHFEFVGLQDLLKLDVECEKDEVWYDVITMVRPNERAKQIIPPKAKLNAIYWERVGKLAKPRGRRRNG